MTPGVRTSRLHPATPPGGAAAGSPGSAASGHSRNFPSVHPATVSRGSRGKRGGVLIDLDELVEHWTLLDDERELIGGSADTAGASQRSPVPGATERSRHNLCSAVQIDEHARSRRPCRELAQVSRSPAARRLSPRQSASPFSTIPSMEPSAARPIRTLDLRSAAALTLADPSRRHEAGNTGSAGRVTRA